MELFLHFSFYNRVFVLNCRDFLSNCFFAFVRFLFNQRFEMEKNKIAKKRFIGIGCTLMVYLKNLNPSDARKYFLSFANILFYYFPQGKAFLSIIDTSKRGKGYFLLNSRLECPATRNRTASFLEKNSRGRRIEPRTPSSQTKIRVQLGTTFFTFV